MGIKGRDSPNYRRGADAESGAQRSRHERTGTEAEQFPEGREHPRT
ncbi:MAG: hypothetical protein ABRQ23_00810 [Syntrophomonadaceae bacterium]